MMIPKLFLLLVLFTGQGHGALKLSSYFADHMVLQRGPQQAVVWGTAATEGATVSAQVTGQGAHAAKVTSKVSHGHWKLKLPAQTATSAMTVTVTSSEGNVTLHDVLFGDVWLCSGQSNMGFTLGHVINASQELAEAKQFPNIRFTAVKLHESPTAQENTPFSTPWTGPSSARLSSFSAVCWLFAKELYPKVNYPIGLVESEWGGTPIEAWSPPEVFTACSGRSKRNQHDHTVLWNAMINPILSTTIYGALWYQGEANAGHAAQYSCLIQNMVKQWRVKFHQSSLQQTPVDFPFGYVQLAPNAQGNSVGSFPAERWAQTANYGFSPNPLLPKTFMAVAMDLPDYHAPTGTIHPRYKQDVAKRLVLGALHVAYGRNGVTFQGPFPSDILPTAHSLNIKYDHGHAALDIRNNHGFEVCCSVHNSTQCDDAHDTWVAAPITGHQASLVTLNTSACGTRHVVGVRYEWRTSPCDLKQCAVYDSRTDLPAPPYISHSLAPIKGPEVIG